jgi:hypothetical protein
MRLEVLSIWRRLWEQPAETAAPTIPEAIIVQPSERRILTRHPCHREAWLHPVSLVKVSAHHAIVLDLSLGGIGLAVERSVANGAFFAIELPDLLAGVTRTYKARVVHSTPQGHAYWRIGCAFVSDLTADELEALV